VEGRHRGDEPERVDRQVIDDAYEEDAVAAAAEYGGEFRSDLESFISPEAVERVVVKGRTFLTFEPGYRYVAFCDPAGGSGGDSMTLVIVRLQGIKGVVCRMVEWKPPFSPDDATSEAAEVLKEYGLSSVVGDHYAGDWPKDRFKAHGIRYVKADKTKSDYYQALLPLLNGGRVELLDHKRTIAQLLGLERSTSRLGKDSISHPPGGHDDLINAAAGALVLVSRPQMLEGYTYTSPLKPKPEHQNGVVMVETFSRHYGKCKHCGAEHLVEKPGDDASLLCPQRGWSAGPWGIGYYTGRRTLE